MYRVFNCGIGMTIQLAAGRCRPCHRHSARRRSGGAHHRRSARGDARRRHRLSRAPRQPIVILISGRGSNMRALIEHSRAPRAYVVAEVISDQADAAGLAAARRPRASRRVHCPRERPWIARGLRPGLAAAIEERFPAADRACRIHAHPLGPIRAALCRKNFEHSSLAAAQVPGLTHASARHRSARCRAWRHGALRHGAARRRPAHHSGPRCGRTGRNGRPSLASACSSRSIVSIPLAVNWFCEGRLRCEAGQAWLDGKPLSEPVQINRPSSRRRPIIAIQPRIDRVVARPPRRRRADAQAADSTHRAILRALFRRTGKASASAPATSSSSKAREPGHYRLHLDHHGARHLPPGLQRRSGADELAERQSTSMLDRKSTAASRAQRRVELNFDWQNKRASGYIGEKAGRHQAQGWHPGCHVHSGRGDARSARAAICRRPFRSSTRIN